MARSPAARAGIDAYCVEPRDIRFTEERPPDLRTETGDQPIAVIYRFYELFDLLNIPKSEFVQYAIKKDRVASRLRISRPWKKSRPLPSSIIRSCDRSGKRNWAKHFSAPDDHHAAYVDSRPCTDSAVRHNSRFAMGGRAVMNWRDLATATQKERHFVIKPSGFSELAWGSRGVSVGHDMPQTEWAAAIDNALASFPTTPYILQEFHKGRLYELDYFDPSGEISSADVRSRPPLPLLFRDGEKTELAGILATVCSADKKVIHGMKDAVMVPCAVAASVV